MLTEQREGKRLATELHDYLGHMMVLGRLKARQARFQAPAADTAHLIEDLDNIFAQSLVYIRALMAELSPPVLHELGLPSALKWLAEQTPTQHPLTVELELAAEHIPLSDDQAMFLYHSVRELLLNVVMHARTSHARVLLTIENNHQLRIAVQDDGHGFDPACLECKSEDKHFGLFSIHEGMAAMEGGLYVDSAPGHGTTITLTLPLTPAVEPKAVHQVAFLSNPKTGTSRQRPPGVLRLLLVDDHALVRQSLRTIIDGYPNLTVVGEAANGEEAVSMAAEAMPDVILMDVNMPQMDGIEATKRIKAAQSNAAIIGLSVNNSAPVMEAMKNAGAAAFILKDVAGEQLYDTITSLTPPPSGLNTPQAA